MVAAGFAGSETIVGIFQLVVRRSVSGWPWYLIFFRAGLQYY